MFVRKLSLLGVLFVLVALISACAAPMPAAAPAAGGDTAAAGSEDGAGYTPGAVECIAPADPGGGWDFTCRSVGKVVSDLGLVDGTVQVTNMSGGGGGVAFAHVVTERDTDNNLIVAASPATTLRLAQGQYGDFTEEDVRWLGALGADFGVVAVRADSEFNSLGDIVAALEADPASLNFGGGSAVGGQDHMKVLVLAQGAGLDPLSIKYTPFDGGGEAMTALLGGFIDVFPGDVSEVLGQLEAGTIKVVATLSPQPLGGMLEGIPTAQEEGYDATWVVFRGFYMPGGVSDDAYNWWADAMTQVADSAEWADVRQQNGLAEFFLVGPDFEEFARNQVANFRQLSIDLGLLE
ncbi:MAG: tripartite tricarboxylate transporter substrate-binding protein [Caldilineaceae bacterium]